MSRLDLNEYLDDAYDPQGPRVPRFRPRKRSQHAILDEVAQHNPLQGLGAEEAFNPSLNTKLHEREWIFTFLGPFYEGAYITDVLRRVKGGKEANVYCCQPRPPGWNWWRPSSTARACCATCATMPATGRGDCSRCGWQGRDQRQRAPRHPQGFFVRQGAFAYLLAGIRVPGPGSAARTPGCSVPRPVTLGYNTILMEYIGDLDMPAPALNETTLNRAQARRVYDELIDAIERMLGLGWIHADLSAYNVLFWDDEPVIIDLPQAVDPWQNPEAWDIFHRDVTRLCQYFTKYGIRSNPLQMAKAMWNRQSPTPPIDPLEIEREEAVEQL